MAGPARVFISYSNKDLALVNRLKDDLKQAGVEVWLDHEKLTPGTLNWQAAVLKGIEQATDVIYAASPDAASSKYVAHELAIAEGEGKRILPFWIRGDKWYFCVPMGFYLAQYTDGRGAAYPIGLATLLAALGATPTVALRPTQSTVRPIATQATAARIAPQPSVPKPTSSAILPERFPARLVRLGYEAYAKDGVEWIVPPVCPIPTGPFKLGSDKQRDPLANANELNRLTVTLPAYSIARFPVTVAEYFCFLAATNRKPPQKGQYNSLSWQDQLHRLDHPVVAVTWRNAFDYAEWLSGRTGQLWRLPTEAEWEKAARCDSHEPLGSSSGRIYPWGDIPDDACYNATTQNIASGVDRRIRRTTPVGAYGPDDPEPDGTRQNGASPCGAEDMAGNVWEWTASEYAADYSKSELLVTSTSTKNRILRGGSWYSTARWARAAVRKDEGPEYADSDVGYRLLLAVLM